MYKVWVVDSARSDIYSTIIFKKASLGIIRHSCSFMKWCHILPMLSLWERSVNQPLQYPTSFNHDYCRDHIEWGNVMFPKPVNVCLKDCRDGAGLFRLQQFSHLTHLELRNTAPFLYSLSPTEAVALSGLQNLSFLVGFDSTPDLVKPQYQTHQSLTLLVCYSVWWDKGKDSSNT